MSVAPGSRFGRYRVIRELGRGGEAIVYLAEDEMLKRSVALKVFPLAIAIEGSAGPPRFRTEVEVLARLDHPGICRIHDAGIEDGFPFIAMSYVEGSTLDLMSQSGEASAVALVEDVARTVASAHAAGVVHGDLKPQNILVTRSGSSVVLDFGIASFLDETRGAGSVQAAGTLAYLAPECLARGPHPPSDVYALGAVLFELVTRRTPFVAPTKAAIVRQILLDDPPLARSHAPEISRDLEAILAKALHRDLERRYATMTDFGADLGRLRRGESVSAARFGPFRRCSRWARRRPALAALVGFVLVFLAGALSIAVIKNHALDRELDRAGFEAGRSVAEAEAAEKHLVRYARLADHRRLEDLGAWARRLVPPRPELLPELRSWIASAEALVGRLAEHRSALEDLRARAAKKAGVRMGSEVSGAARREIEALKRRRFRLAATAEQAAGEEARGRALAAVKNLDGHLEKLRAGIPQVDEWTYASAADGWHDATLSALVDDLERFAGTDLVLGTMREITRRISEAQRLDEDLGASRAIWDEAIRAIGDRRKSPLYGGLALRQQIGLVPLGPNVETGLWEFLHVLSGRAPEPPGGHAVIPETGIVLVLLPGGTARMGARRPGQGEPSEGPHVDSEASPPESPIDDVLLDPFFISKFEMTEAQWLRAIAAEDGGGSASVPRSTARPVAAVAWHDATRTLGRIGLVLPSEAQWEYAARAGTTTPWWTAADSRPLSAAENFARKDILVVGTLLPNAFGLFDVAGNVCEWCADVFAPYESPTLASTGERSALDVPDQRVYRGGSYLSQPTQLRSARRNADSPTVRLGHLGIRPARPLDR